MKNVDFVAYSYGPISSDSNWDYPLLNGDNKHFLTKIATTREKAGQF